MLFNLAIQIPLGCLQASSTGFSCFPGTTVISVWCECDRDTDSSSTTETHHIANIQHKGAADKCRKWYMNKIKQNFWIIYIIMILTKYFLKTITMMIVNMCTLNA